MVKEWIKLNDDNNKAWTELYDALAKKYVETTRYLRSKKYEEDTRKYIIEEIDKIFEGDKK